MLVKKYGWLSPHEHLLLWCRQIIQLHRRGSSFIAREPRGGVRVRRARAPTQSQLKHPSVSGGDVEATPETTHVLEFGAWLAHRWWEAHVSFMDIYVNFLLEDRDVFSSMEFNVPI